MRARPGGQPDGLAERAGVVGNAGADRMANTTPKGTQAIMHGVVTLAGEIRFKEILSFPEKAIILREA